MLVTLNILGNGIQDDFACANEFSPSNFVEFFQYFEFVCWNTEACDITSLPHKQLVTN